MDEEVATSTPTATAIATEASMLVLKTNTTSQDDDDDDDLNVNTKTKTNVNSKTNKIKIGIAAAVSVSVFVIGGTTTTFTLAGFSSNSNNNNIMNNDIAPAVEMNLLRTSTITNTVEATTTPNCCNVADGIFQGGDDGLENCYVTGCDCNDTGCHGCQYCWSKSYFKNGDTEQCLPHGNNWDLYCAFNDDAPKAPYGDCGSPCTSFASNAC